MPPRRRPTAAFCANDLLALGLLQEMVRHGSAVPDDIAIVGFDDIDFAAAAAVPLSSVRKPRHELVDGRPSCCSTRRADPTTGTSSWCSSRSSSSGSRACPTHRRRRPA